VSLTKYGSGCARRISGKVIDLVTQRKGEMHVMETKGQMQHLEFDIPSRGLIGLRSQMLTNTAGEAVMAHRFAEYKPWKGFIRAAAMVYYWLSQQVKQRAILLINSRTGAHSL